MTVGALGSQIIDLLARAGFGKWTLIDQDVLLPHNLTRHALRGNGIGWPKAARLAQEIDNYYEEPQKTTWHKTNILDAGDSREKLAAALSATKLILDLSASVSVARHLALDVEAVARRVSIFLNPTGTDLVMLAEDEERQISLDCLELQYYRAVACQPELENHLAAPERAIRYSRSCRDLTARMPNHLVTLNAAIAANAVRHTLDVPTPAIEIWRAAPDTLAVTHAQIQPARVQAHQLGRWTLVVDAHLQARLTDLRLGKLPNETGGVLIGAYDFPRQIVYVVDTIPSPPDSEEWPTLYIRGAAGLAQEVQRISAVTDGQLGYVGEWHSHPDDCSCQPSDDDLKVFSWLTETLADDGKPSLMAIAGENRTSAWFLGEMLRSGGWEVQAPLDQLEEP
jgi:integrative and conjugative element protein (TIGR02256 family)